MESKYNNKYERTLISEGYHFHRLIGPVGLYKNWEGKIILATVKPDGKLEVLLEAKVETGSPEAPNRTAEASTGEDDLPQAILPDLAEKLHHAKNKTPAPQEPSEPHSFDKHGFFKKER